MYHFIVNPASKSGKGLKIWQRLLPVLQEKQTKYDVYFTKGTGDISAYLASIDSVSEDFLKTSLHILTSFPNRLIVLGGDGTINEVLQAIRRPEQTCIAYIPAGSSNDLARDLFSRKRTPEELLLHILAHQEPIAMDVGICSSNLAEYRFAVSCGIGFDAAVCEEALHSSIKKVLNRFGLGKLTYLGIALKQLFSTAKTGCDLYLDDELPIHLDRFLFAAAMIHRYEGGGFCFCPKADAFDGMLDICVIGDLSKLKALCLLPTAFLGKHLQFKNVKNYRAAKVRIHTSSPLFVHTDGEVNIQSEELVIQCKQKQFYFFGIQEDDS